VRISAIRFEFSTCSIDCAVEVAQHVGIASTAGFDITTGIDVQAPPGGCTVEIAHTVFTVRVIGTKTFWLRRSILWHGHSQSAFGADFVHLE
jgi:hypothetical protein